MKKQTIFSALKGLFPYVATPAMLVWIIYTYSTDKAVNGTKMFDNPVQKVEHIQHVNGSLSPLKQREKFIFDSINANDAIKSRAKRDSAGIARDSISLLNADQIFQIKEQQKVLIEEIRKIH